MVIFQIICSVITALSTIFIALQFYQMKKAEEKNHEEMRRIKTIEVMQNWSSSLKKETSFAEKIVEGFSEEQCRALYFGEEIKIEDKKGENICQICPENSSGCSKCKKGNKFKLNGVQLSEFRWYVITYLNMLENVMTAWNLKIVDTDEIEQQFQYLYNPEKGWNALEAFRKAAGGNKAYPNIDRFIKLLKDKSEQTKEVDKL